VQARMGSTRLPGKVMKTVLGKPLLGYLIDRLKRVKHQNTLVIATTTHSKDDPIVQFCEKESVYIYRGSEEDVLDRYLQAAHLYQADMVVRVTSDCPLIDPEVIDQTIDYFLQHDVDYVSNTILRTYPRGMDVETFTIKALQDAASFGTKKADREHVTYYIYSHPEKYQIGQIQKPRDDSKYRWTVDTSEDFDLIKTILEAVFPKNPEFTLTDLLILLEKHPEWNQINAHIQQKKADD
jgi:spore coat polysaccharide biosynthesis protein SpsF